MRGTAETPNFPIRFLLLSPATIVAAGCRPDLVTIIFSVDPDRVTTNCAHYFVGRNYHNLNVFLPFLSKDPPQGTAVSAAVRVVVGALVVTPPRLVVTPAQISGHACPD